MDDRITDKPPAPVPEASDEEPLWEWPGPPMSKTAKGCLWALFTEIAFTLVGAVVRAILYLPGRIDGWFYWSMIMCGIAGAFLGSAVSTGVLLWWVNKK